MTPASHVDPELWETQTLGFSPGFRSVILIVGESRWTLAYLFSHLEQTGLVCAATSRIPRVSHFLWCSDVYRHRNADCSHGTTESLLIFHCWFCAFNWKLPESMLSPTREDRWNVHTYLVREEWGRKEGQMHLDGDASALRTMLQLKFNEASAPAVRRYCADTPQPVFCSQLHQHQPHVSFCYHWQTEWKIIFRLF